MKTQWDKEIEYHKRRADRQLIGVAGIHALIVLVVISLTSGGLPW